MVIKDDTVLLLAVVFLLKPIESGPARERLRLLLFLTPQKV